MGSFVIYILEWSACLLGFMLLYKMCFSGTTFHRFNRFYLLGTVVLSAILPLIHIAPTDGMEPIAESCRTAVWVEESPLSSLRVSSALDADNEGLTTTEKGAMVLLAMYVMYVLIQLVGWTKAAVKMLWFLRGKRRHRLGSWVWIVEHDAEYGPFSWMNVVCISSHEQGFGRRASIRHELSHIQLLHHIDLLMLMACVIINPTCWIVMKEIKIVHEYEADDEVINHYRIQSRDYQRLLIMRTVGAEAYALASSFNLNIKKRIIMMKKKQSHWWRMIWIAVTVPLVGIALTAFSKPKETLKEVVDSRVRTLEQPIVKALSSESTEPEVVENPTPAPEKKVEAADDVKPGDKITGCVKDATGPLGGANIMELDENGRIVAYTTTDKKGNYELKVTNPKHKIRFSFVGFKSQTFDLSSRKIDVTLEEAMKFSQIQVVGYHDSIDSNAPRYRDEDTTSGDEGTFNMVEQNPTFPGGQGEIMKYLSIHLRYPVVAREMQVEAEITVQFIVDKTGFVRSPQVVEVSSKTPIITAETTKAAKEGNEEAVETVRNYNDAIEALKEEAIHVVRNMPRWEPGRQNGKRTDTTYTLPISFKLN